MAKSTVYFGNVTEEAKEEIKMVMPFIEGYLPIRYLRIPLDANRITKSNCTVLLDKVGKRIDDWRNKDLSYAGRMQLIDSVLSSLNVFWAFIFILPQGVCYDVDKLLKNFLWKTDGRKGYKHSVSWKENMRFKEVMDIQAPKIAHEIEDKVVWINKKGKVKDFYVNEVWNGIRNSYAKVILSRLLGLKLKTTPDVIKAAEVWNIPIDRLH
ncbi:hypothetical protein Tco_1218627 [Tanacetum coccineum]